MAQKRISTGTNGIPEVDCGQILRQFSSVIKLRTDQFAMCKAKHPSVLAVLRMRKKTPIIANNLDTKLNYQLCSWDNPKKLLLRNKILNICISYL